MMAFRKLDRQIQILRRVQTGVTHANEPVFAETVFATLWAAMAPVSEGEAFVASQRYERRVVTFKARWFDGLEATDVILCDGVRYGVTGWRELGRRDAILITAEAQE